MDGCRCVSFRLRPFACHCCVPACGLRWDVSSSDVGVDSFCLSDGVAEPLKTDDRRLLLSLRSACLWGVCDGRGVEGMPAAAGGVPTIHTMRACCFGSPMIDKKKRCIIF